MKLSLIALAEAIDRLVDTNQACVVESESAAFVSALSAAHASEIKALCEPLGWPVEVFDQADESWDTVDAPDPDFAPFRVVIKKPAAPTNALQLLCNHAFAQWLERGHVAPRWHIARFTGTIVLGIRIIQSWGGAQQEVALLPTTKSPRALVKEFGNARRVPEDVRCWLTAPLESAHFAQPATQVWVRSASAALINCLPDEIDSDGGTLKFRGPPRLTLPGFDPATEDMLDHETFGTLLSATKWVFEHEREAEMRHILLAAELARSGTATACTPAFLRQHLAHAWESAQIAYQMALAETGRDTLKILSDLRKAVTEETAKLSDISRQLTGSVAAAVATGIGLIAARVSANASAVLVSIIMFIVALYIAMVILSGMQFMRLQRQLRTDWQHRLYRFLPDAEFERMVKGPTRKAEHSFVWTAWFGGVSIVILTLACGLVVLIPTSNLLASKHVSISPGCPSEQSSGPAVTTISSMWATSNSTTNASVPPKGSYAKTSVSEGACISAPRVADDATGIR